MDYEIESSPKVGLDHVIKPWGEYIVLCETASYKVKRIIVNPNATLSLQSHTKRNEYWIVMSGVAKVTLDNKIIFINERESIYIPKQCKHRLANESSNHLIVMEIQTGDYFGEDDIVRYEDIYGRI